MNMVKITSKKTAGSTKNDILPEELSNVGSVKLNMLRKLMRSNFIESLLVDQVFLDSNT